MILCCPIAVVKHYNCKKLETGQNNTVDDNKLITFV